MREDGRDRPSINHGWWTTSDIRGVFHLRDSEENDNKYTSRRKSDRKKKKEILQIQMRGS